MANPRKGLRSVGHGRPLPLVALPKPESTGEVEASQAEVVPAPQITPKPKASAAVAPATDGADPDRSGRLRVRQRDNATLVRKSWRLREGIVEQLSEYCKRERWPETEIVERALAHYLDELVGGPEGAAE